MDYIHIRPFCKIDFCSIDKQFLKLKPENRAPMHGTHHCCIKTKAKGHIQNPMRLSGQPAVQKRHFGRCRLLDRNFERDYPWCKILSVAKPKFRALP